MLAVMARSCHCDKPSLRGALFATKQSRISGLPRLAKNARLAMTLGYTLIEILIVLFIISIVTTTALLTISHNSNKTMESFADQLMQTLTLAEEQAILQPSVIGLHVDEQSFRFSSLQEEAASQKNTWVPLQDSILGKHRIPNGIEVSVKVDAASADAEKKNPQIIISTNGEATPFTIYVGKPGEKPLYAIRGEADGSISNKMLT